MTQDRRSPESVSLADHEALIFGAELGTSAPEIDLHGMDTIDATRAVDLFLDQQFMAEERVVRIIHGRGTGALRGAVHRLLAQNAHVEYFRDAQAQYSQGGVTYAVLARRSS